MGLKVFSSNNKDWGCWGTAQLAGYDVEVVWQACSRFFLESVENMTSEMTRDLLDGRFGRHLVDELSFLKGPKIYKTIKTHLSKRFKEYGWQLWFTKSMVEVGHGQHRGGWLL